MAPTAAAPRRNWRRPTGAGASFRLGCRAEGAAEQEHQRGDGGERADESRHDGPGRRAGSSGGGGHAHQAEEGDAGDADPQPLDREDPDHDGEDSEQDDGASDEHRLVVRAELADGELLDPHGYVVDHPLPDGDDG